MDKAAAERTKTDFFLEKEEGWERLWSEGGGHRDG